MTITARQPLWLEAAGEEDLPALLALEARCYTHPWTRQHFREALGEPDRRRALVLRAPWRRGDGERGIRAYCVVEWVLDEAHIHNLAVHPDHRRGGLARRLLGLTLGLAGRRGAEAVLLEVRQSNWAAQSLYRAFGFEIIGLRRDYYTGPTEDALVLRLGALRAACVNLEIARGAC